jgi:hypothetical protein
MDKREVLVRLAEKGCYGIECGQCPFDHDDICNQWSMEDVKERAKSALMSPSVVDDVVRSPKHYTDGGIETIDFIEAKGLGYRLGNCVKYISRAGKKNADKEVEDLKKALWYLEREIALKEGK